MKTQADSAKALRKSLDSGAASRPGQALPEGWRAFKSESTRTGDHPHWYAASPHPVGRLQRTGGAAAADLAVTVAGDTWDQLRAEVMAQDALYMALTEEPK